MYNLSSVHTDVVTIHDVKTSVYKIPTETPESDGTIKWNSTTLVLVQLQAGNKTGIGYTHANAAAAVVINSMLKEWVQGSNCMNIPAITTKLTQQIRNEGSTGIAMMAVSAIDNALWDLKAKQLELPLCMLLGKAQDAMNIYGSGGFTSYSKQQLQHQLSNWAEEGITAVKMKIGRDANADVQRVAHAREAIGEDVQLFVDANGGYTAKQAIEKAKQFEPYHISWFEEPVSSDNLAALQFIRQQVQPLVQIAAGEYGYNLYYFKKMLEAKSVDVLQADATRCGGISGFMQAGYLAKAYEIPFSAHCAPSLHLHAALALPNFYIAEYFHDHARIESMLFDGVSPPVDGCLQPDLTRPGFGLDFKHGDAAQYKQ